MNPYESLGVEKDADPETIKKAYRSLAKKHHPDTGADSSKITDLTTAYDILSDPEKRKRFDETGESGPTNEQHQIYTEFLKMSEEILLKYADKPVKSSLGLIQKGIEAHGRDAKTKVQDQIDILNKAKARILKAPENDVLGTMIAQRLDDLTKQMGLLDHQMEIAYKALALFDEYQITEPDPFAGTMLSGTIRFV